MYALASRLHKTISEIGDITIDEFHTWIAFFNKEAEKQADKQ